MESSVVAPAIVIAVTDECSEQWRDVLLGIEEEGIPFCSAAADRRRSYPSRPGRRRSVRRCR
ncbi:propanediol dehydratase reactivation factor small subunit [Klebsiella pneumoniae]|uniref:Propanediol dehydratase reactivation factor small subunit n=1 Tax=Klebsiella pneumoniae TaxID=573 RepID=A0A447RQ65_KLEPN|nr:propanediol dehydratase reactivation factor small subunit [Klebsiella pneumoniae]